MEGLNTSLLPLNNNISEIVNYFSITTESSLVKDVILTDSFYETKRLIYLVTLPIIIIGGTLGNILTFIVMQRGSLKDVSTCFYMAILALSDSGK